MTSPILKRLAALRLNLTDKEVKFVEAICASPGRKFNGPDEAYDSELLKSLWEKPIRLGLIRTMGSYKWVPNTTRWQGWFNSENETSIHPMIEATPDVSPDDLSGIEQAALQVMKWKWEDPMPQPIIPPWRTQTS